MAGIAEHTDDYDGATFERRIVDLVQRNQTVTKSTSTRESSSAS